MIGMPISKHLSVGLRKGLSLSLSFFFAASISFFAWAQPVLEQLASERSRQFEQEKERFATEQPAGLSGWQFSRYSSLGVPLFLAPLNLTSARATGAATLTEAQNGIRLHGEGMQIATWDDGLVAPHVELGTRVIATEGTQLKTHATHVAGTLIASGVQASVRGMAPAAHLLAFLFDNDEAEMAALAASKGAGLLVSNHSYGTVTGWTGWGGSWRWAGFPAVSEAEDYNFGLYTAKAQLLDEIAMQAPFYTICWAAGNDRAEVGNGTFPPDCNGGTGYDCIIPDAVAKNIITVGAIDQLPAYSSSASVIMSSYSSWGPTDDGRIKPDLVGVGTGVFSLQAAPANSYTFLSGTSMATPNVAGSLLLLQELHQKLRGGTSMRAATLKALAIHHTREAGPFPGPDYSFGWGLLDVGACAQTLVQADDRQNIIRELTLATGASYTLQVLPAAGKKITVTMVWTDPPGAPAPDRLDPTDLALVNDLDMRLVDDLGTTHFPWILNPANPGERATRGDNFRDNVEKIELENPAGRPYEIRINHKGALRNGSQAFSLIVTYTPATATRTLYWIGDEGNWNEGAKWSLASGGAPAFVVPGPGDRVIVDENSFDSVGPNEIVVSAPVAIRSFLWLDSQPSGLDLDGPNITITRELKIASRRFTLRRSGTIVLENTTPSASTADFFDLNTPNLTLQLLAGDWQVSGKLRVAAISRLGGNLSWNRATIQTGVFDISGTTAPTLKLTASTMVVTKACSLVAADVTVQSDQSSIAFRGNCTFEASNRQVLVPLRLDSGQLTLVGNNARLGNLRAAGRLIVSGIHQIEQLSLAVGAEVLVQANARLRVAGIDAQNDSRWTGLGNSTLELTHYKKICLTRARVIDLTLAGKGVVTVGADGLISNSPGWQSVSCETLVFANFSLQYPCQDGNTVFVDASAGAPEVFKWQVQQANQQQARSGFTTSYRFRDTGAASVRLRVEKNGVSHERDSTFVIRPNTLPPNSILATSERLMSFAEADRYEWYRNEVAISGVSGRMFTHSGEPGTYQVLAFREPCNRWSEVYVVTGFESTGVNQHVVLAPNPADQELHVYAAQPVIQTVFFDLAGRELFRQSGDRIDLAQLPSGLYLCEVHTGLGRTRRKVVVRH